MGENVKESGEKRRKIYWHEAFYWALQMELLEYEDVFEFTNEYQLSQEALKIDVVVIKKEKDVRIEKNLGRIFRACNIFEYKSETDSLSVSDYDKVLAYGLLYSVFMKVPKSDMTLSFAYTRHPRELLKYLEGERKFAVDDQGGGIYYIRGEVFPVQLVER
ncbi:MAG: hypothetical protein FWG40_12040, partial [Peptococcaceae bacterium]|nr:hypothetical protein [Peptococcaceae bacterium]